MRRITSTLLFVLAVLCVQAQVTVKGTIVDESSKEPLIGANILHKASSTGTITDIDGSFTLELPDNARRLEISYLGYNPYIINLDGQGPDFDLGTLRLAQSAFGLDEVVISGTMDIVRDRRTPVAVSTINTAEIQAKGGNVEFPELMKSTPSIYVAGQAGGYGDSEVFTRGFDQTNTAFLLNGQPINGMEDGRMYWSNWSGMTDVATAVQVQRGLGSSKLAISSVGGTTNIIMKPTAQRKGGSVSFLRGNDSYNKITASYNTGMNGKFGMSVLLTHWQGDGWAEGTKGQGQNYFISAGYNASPRHQFNFLLTGAPQWHDQNFNKRISSHYQGGSEFNIKYNGNFGTLGGEYKTLRRNYYHKPVANMNWEWSLNEKSSLSTVLYGSWGRGGGTGDIGNRNNRFFTSDGYIDWDMVRSANVADAGDEEWVIRASVNNHNWVGIVTNYETILSRDLTLSLGADLRRYHGSHFRQIVDLVGAPAYSQRANARFGAREITNTFSADPWAAISGSAGQEDRIAYTNDETIAYMGVFGQLEYTKNSFTGYFQGALSNQSHVRFELFNETEANEDSEKVKNLGYNLKTGFSIELNENSNFYINTGYYQRQPFHDDIYLNFSNTVNRATVPEKIFGLEAGYKYSSRDFALNLNLYRTSWKDRATTRTIREGDELPNGQVLTAEAFRNSVQNQLHSGIELDFSYDASEKFRLKGFASVGDWGYDGTISTQIFSEDRVLLYESDGDDIDGVKVGGAAQTTFGLGADYKVSDAFKLDLDYNFYSNLYSNISASNDALKLPSFGLFDLGLSYRINMSDDRLMTFRVNVYNLFGKEYISRATSAFEAATSEADNWNGINKDNFVTFGKTRTWNVSARYSF